MKDKNNVPLQSLALCLCGALLWGMAASARAELVLDVTVNTAALQGEAGSEVFFALTDGSGIGDGNNTVTLTNFSLGGGTLEGVDPFETFGGASGDMGSTVSMTDTSPFNMFGEFLAPGASLSFTLDATTNIDSGPIPDGLYMFLSDPFGNYLSTTDPTGGNSLFTVTFDSDTPSVVNYDPVPPSTSVTEPDTVLLAASAFMILAGLRVGGRRATRRPPSTSASRCSPIRDRPS